MRFPEGEDADLLIIPYSKDGRILSEAGRRVDWILDFKISKNLNGNWSVVLFHFKHGVRAPLVVCILDDERFEAELLTVAQNIGGSQVKMCLLKEIGEDALNTLSSQLPHVKINVFA